MKIILLETINILFIEFINLADSLHVLFWQKYDIFYGFLYGFLKNYNLFLKLILKLI